MAKVQLRNLPLCFLDTETTGLKPKNGDRLIELALVRLEGGKVTDRFTTLVDAGISVPDFITDVNKITDDHLVGAPTFADVADAVAERMAGTVVVAHNMNFDWGFMVAEYKRLGRQAPDAPWFCTLEMARETLSLPKNRLVDCCEHFGITLEDAHEALADTVACAEVALRLLELAETRGGGWVDVDAPRPELELRPERTRTLREWLDLYVPTDELTQVPVKVR